MLKNEQGRRGLTDYAVAQLLDCSQQSYNSWKGGTVPRTERHAAIANYLKISPDMMLELVEEAKLSTGSTKLPTGVRKYGKVADRKDGRFKFEPINAGRKRVPEGRYMISVDTKVMEPALHVGTTAWLDPSVWPKPGHEVLVHAEGGAAWLGVLVSLNGSEAHLSRHAAEPIVIEDVVAIHVVTLSERTS